MQHRYIEYFTINSENKIKILQYVTNSNFFSSFFHMPAIYFKISILILKKQQKSGCGYSYASECRFVNSCKQTKTKRATRSTSVEQSGNFLLPSEDEKSSALNCLIKIEQA